jgi:hypothetical protein
MKVISIHNFKSSSGSGTVINYGSGSDFLTSYGSGSGSTSQKVTVPTVPVPVLVPQRWYKGLHTRSKLEKLYVQQICGILAYLNESRHISTGTLCTENLLRYVS